MTDIKIAHKMLNPKDKKKEKEPDVNPLDENYNKLNCDIKTVKNND